MKPNRPNTTVHRSRRTTALFSVAPLWLLLTCLTGCGVGTDQASEQPSVMLQGSEPASWIERGQRGVLREQAGYYAEAITDLERAMEVASALRVPIQHPELDPIMASLLNAYMDSEQTRHAEPLVHRLIKARSKRFGEDSLETTLARQFLPTLAHVERRNDEALLTFRSLRAEFQAHRGVHLPGYQILLNDFGVSLAESGETAEAEAIWREALSLPEAPGREVYATSLYNLADHLLNANNPELGDPQTAEHFRNKARQLQATLE